MVNLLKIYRGNMCSRPQLGASVTMMDIFVGILFMKHLLGNN